MKTFTVLIATAIIFGNVLVAQLEEIGACNLTTVAVYNIQNNTDF